MKDHAAIILRDGNKVLFVQRAATKKALPNIWAFPSGTMEEDETAETTAVREAKEELQVDVRVENTLGVVELLEMGARLHLMLCIDDTHKEPVFDPEEIQAIRWMTFDEFFDTYSDEQIGHGLRYLRAHPAIWKSHFA